MKIRLRLKGEKKEKYLSVICLYCLLFQLFNEICSTLGCQQKLLLVSRSLFRKCKAQAQMGLLVGNNQSYQHCGVQSVPSSKAMASWSNALPDYFPRQTEPNDNHVTSQHQE